MRPLVLVIALVSLSACDEMAQQPKDVVYGASALFPGGAAMQPPPDGAVARGDLAYRVAASERPPMSFALLARGRERFEIYCAVCHDPSGYGQGVIPSRGFPHPPSFHSARLRQAPASHVVDVITHGYGVMYAYADRVTPADRWAIAAYVRALQLSQAAPFAALSADDRARVEAADGR